MKYTYVAEVFVTDPDSEEEICVEIWKDNDSGGMFGLESSFTEQCDNFYNPFNGDEEEIRVYLPDP